jgi:type II secretory pathway pseudopilin PulG
MTRTLSTRSVRVAQGGYAYLALLILIAIIGVVAATAVQIGGIHQRRLAEEELLFVGGEFQRALLSYAAATPVGQPTQPRTLDDLVRDPRYPNPMRHLRKLYADPVTGKSNWVLVKSPDGQTIVGLHSASVAQPIKIAQFPPDFKGFEDKRHYAEWVFVAPLRAPIRPGVANASMRP